MKIQLFAIALLLLWHSGSIQGQTMKLAIDHLESLDKTGEVVSSSFFEYSIERFLNRKEKIVARKKAKMLEILQTQQEKIAKENPFNGQLRLKNAYTNFITKIKQFPENLEVYSELNVEDYQTGKAQKRKQEFIIQIELLKTAANEVNVEAVKYITMNKLKDFKQGSTLPQRWEKAASIFAYCQKIQVAVSTVGALEREFYQKLALDSLEKSEIIRKSILQNAATLTASVKIKPAVPTDFSLREAAINSFNMYRQDAFRNFKSLIDSRKRELLFKQKYPAGADKTKPNHSKIELEQSQITAEVSSLKNLQKEMKKDREKHENAFNEYLAQYLNQWVLE